MLSLGFEYLLLIVPAALFAITMHEFAHGYVSYKLGDPSAKVAGRLTLNPISHLDLMGAIALVVIGIGWAKPVPIDPSFYKKKKLGVILTSIAGPTMNFILAFISIFILTFFDLYTNINYFATEFLYIFAMINIGLGLFNLIPIPPLDGSKVVASLIPNKYYDSYMKIERYGFIVLFAILFLFGFSFISAGISFLLSTLINFSEFILTIF